MSDGAAFYDCGKEWEAYDLCYKLLLTISQHSAAAIPAHVDNGCTTTGDYPGTILHFLSRLDYDLQIFTLRIPVRRPMRLERSDRLLPGLRLFFYNSRAGGAVFN